MEKNYFKLAVVFYTTLFALCFVIGIIYGNLYLDISLIEKDLLESFKIVSIHNLLLEVGIIAISFLLVKFIIGKLVFLMFFSFKSFSIGFIIYTFIKVYKGSIIPFISVYVIINILLYLILYVMYYTLIKLLYVYVYRKYIKKERLLKEDILVLFKRGYNLLLIYFIYNVFIYFIESNIIGFFI